jgi:hypothetical protein
MYAVGKFAFKFLAPTVTVRFFSFVTLSETTTEYYHYYCIHTFPRAAFADNWQNINAKV